MLCLSACSRPSLSSFIEYIDNDYTAAAHLGVEPSYVHKMFGQQVVVTWGIPSRMRKSLPMVIHLCVYYGNGQVEKLTYEVNQQSGYRIYCLKDNEYDSHQGITSYKVSLCSGDREIISRRHHLWTEVIPLDNLVD